MLTIPRVYNIMEMGYGDIIPKLWMVTIRNYYPYIFLVYDHGFPTKRSHVFYPCVRHLSSQLACVIFDDQRLLKELKGGQLLRCADD